VRQIVLGCPDRDLIGRVRTFRVKLLSLLRRQSFDLIHFRSIFEGYPLARGVAGSGTRLLYEVNGLPSIELKYAHPRLRGDTGLQAKLEHQEQACLGAADHVITVSEVTRAHLLGRGCPAEKITVLPNGVDVDLFAFAEPPAVGEGPLRILYAGTLSAWQGIDVLLDAFLLVSVSRPAVLTLVGLARSTRREELHRRVRRAGVEQRVIFHPPADRATVARLLHEHHCTAVPLTAVDRNTVQGCCPLKLLEAMAAGCPLVASDLPVVRELARPGEHFLALAPDDPAGLALALLRVADEPRDSRERTRRARRHVAEHLRWEQSTRRLLALYEEMLAVPARR
jgi:glycosyltransferase involved in cell wall biosynthesis